MSCTVNQSNSHLRTFERVNSYPIVKDSFLLAFDYYQWAKSKNLILDVTLNKLEGVLKTVKDKTEPIAAERLHYIDETVCQQLLKFEKLCPIILEPSKNIADIPSNIYHQRIEPSLLRVALPVSHTLDLVTRTSCATASMMSSIITAVLPPTNIPQDATKLVLNKTEQMIDRFFPDTNGECHKESRDDGIYKKIKRLSTKSRQRIYKKVVKDIDRFRKVSLEKLEQIYSIIQEIKNSKASACREKFACATENSRYQQLIKDGLQYSDYLQHMVTSTVQAMPRFLCSNTMSALDLLNEKLFSVRNTIQSSSNRKILSDKRISQAAHTIEFVRSWIEYFTDNLKAYYRTCETKDKDECDVGGEEEETEEESSTDGESDDDGDGDSNPQ